jgi:hypothetical protein
MGNTVKKLMAVYFDSRWAPSVAASIVLIAFMAASLTTLKRIPLLVNSLLLLQGLSLIGMPAAAVWNFVKKRWRKGIVNLIMFPLVLTVCFFGSSFFMFTSMLGPSGDGFADHLIIPEGIDLFEPKDRGFEAPQDGQADAFQSNLLAALKMPGNEDPFVTADLPFLLRLQDRAPDIFKRYLSSSPSWRVFQERGAVFATRRWMVGSHWRYGLNGYYMGHGPFMLPIGDMPKFQSRVTLGLSGKSWSRVSRKSTRMQPGETMRLTISEGNQMKESHCVINAGGCVVEIFEQSETAERRLTKAVLGHLKEEFRSLAEVPESSTIRRLLPSGAMKRGKPTLELFNSLQPGIYDSEIWVNPGEPGMIYLKVYEVTGEQRLSANRLKERSNEWVGWSEDDFQLFLSNTQFTIYEGDWGNPYAARFEVWFVPDSGRPERKLLEKIYKIEGWQR